MTLPNTHDMLTQLTRPHRHSESYAYAANGTTYSTDWHVTAPPLLQQLEHSTPLTSGDIGGSGYGSRPAASVEALDTLMLIDDEATRWITRLGGTKTTKTTISCVKRIGGLYAGLNQDRHTVQREKGQPPTCCDRHRLEADIRRWWTQARVVSGWDSAAFKPNNTCPLCNKRGTLRIRQSDLAALCTGCHETWDETTIGLLGEHIRRENHDDSTTETTDPLEPPAVAV